MQEFDEETSRRVEATYQTPDIVAQRAAVRAALSLRPAEHVLDIGSGPGLLATEMAGEVGSSGSVQGIDPSDSMFELAERRTRWPGSGPITLTVGDATKLPFADATFDAVTATQVYEYVAEIEGALAEAHRVLRRGGRILILDTDWESLVWHSSDQRRMDRVLEVWDDHLADPHLPRRLGRLLREAGFATRVREVVPILNAGYDAHTFSGGLIEIISRFVSGRGGITEDEAAAWAADLRGLGADYFFSINRYLFIATP